MRFSIIFLAWLCAAPLCAQDITLNINGREYLLPPTTAVRLRGVDTTASSLLNAPEGLQVRWDSRAQRGTEPELIFAYTLEGPVTHLEPLTVLGQAITRDGNTIHEGLAASTPLVIGQELSVAGLVDANGSLLATLVELPEGPLPQFALTGYVQAIDGNGDFLVGEQWVSPGNAVALDCPATITIGSYVSLTADPIEPFPPGTRLGNLTHLQCTQPVELGTPGASGWVQGLISQVDPAGNFKLGDLDVQLNPSTSYRFGSADDIDVGSAVSIDGTFVDAQTLAATAIEFAHEIVRFEAPLLPEGVVIDASTSPFGLLVRSTTQLRDEDGIVASGLASETQVQVRGYQDQAGNLWMTRVRDRGNPDFEDTALRAPVTAIDGTTLTVLGLTVDTSQSVFLDLFENPITAEQFFAALQIGDSVDVAAAQWIPNEARLVAGEVGFARVVPPAPLSIRGQAGGVVSGTARGYQRSSNVFNNGFEAN